MRRHPKRRPQRPSGGTVTLEPTEVQVCGTGSSAAVSPVLVHDSNSESSGSEGAEQEARNGPVLKLSKKPDLTSKQTTAQNSHNSNIGSALADIGQPTLILRGDGTHPSDKVNETLMQYSDYTESYHYNDKGLSRGEKRANDGSWSERWLQQKLHSTAAAPTNGAQPAQTQGSAPTLVLKSGTAPTPGAASASVSTLRNTAPTDAVDAIVFGTATGTNAVLRQRWTEDWRREGNTLTVKRLVQRIDCSEVSENTAATEIESNRTIREWLQRPQAAVLEEWREESVTDENTGFTTVRLAGRDLLSGRTWQKQSSEHNEGSTSEPETDSFTGLKIKFKGRFEQFIDGCRRGNVMFVFEDGSSRYMSWCKVDGGEEWNDEWIEDVSTAKRGFKSGTNLRGEHWKEKWRETAVDRESDRWSQSACGHKMWGDKHGVAANGQTYDERWCRQREDLDEDSHEAQQVVQSSSPNAEVPSVYKEVFFIDKWWTEGDNRWGEKKKTLRATRVANPTEIAFKNDEDGGAASTTRGVIIEECNEKWYDNGDERVVDSWNRSYAYAPVNKPSGTSICSIRESGSTKGERASDGSVWGEQWKKDKHRRTGTVTATYLDQQPTVAPIKTVEVNGTDSILDASRSDGAHAESTVPCKTIDKPDTCGDVTDEDEMVISKRMEDKWWRDKNENSWGNSCFEDLDANHKQYESWYDNGFEKQVDRWQVDGKGSKWGEKFGSKRDGTEWREKWGKEQDGTAETVEREWTEYRDGTRRDWGEKFGHAGNRQWTENWGKMIAESGYGDVSEWVVKWDDDGFGNFKTEQENKAYREGIETEWSRNRYGECLGSSEKWAHKEGWNHVGDRWMERWNETPEVKSAEKTGSNPEGDRWRETWTSETTETGQNKRRAEKSGATSAGRQWNEAWVEDGKSKWARKQCETESGAGWVEEWGERFDGEEGEKWASKWAKDEDGSKWGSSWGDGWWDGQGRRWGEEWKGDDIRKWAHETSGRPAGA